MSNRLSITVAYTICLFIPLLNLYVIYKVLRDGALPRGQKWTSVLMWVSAVVLGVIASWSVPALLLLSSACGFTGIFVMIGLIWFKWLQAHDPVRVAVRNSR